MSGLAVTSVVSSTPTVTTGQVTFDVADPSQLTPFIGRYVEHWPSKDWLAPLSRAKNTRQMRIDSISGKHVTATLETAGRAVSAGDIIDASQLRPLTGFLALYEPGGAMWSGLGEANLHDGGRRLEIVDGSDTAPVLFDKATVFISRDGKQGGVCTFSVAVPTVVTQAAHGYSVGDTVFFANEGGALPVRSPVHVPTNLVAATAYYVVSVPTANTYTFADTAGGTAIGVSGAGTGTHYAANGVGQFASGILIYNKNQGSMSNITSSGLAAVTIEVGRGDAVGLAGTANIHSTATGTDQESFAGYFLAGAEQANAYAIALNPLVQVNHTTPYTDGDPTSAGVLAQASWSGVAAQAYETGAAFVAYGDNAAGVNAIWSGGYVIEALSAKTFGYWDRSNSVRSILIDGQHTYLWDSAAATFDGTLQTVMKFRTNFAIQWQGGANPRYLHDSGDYTDFIAAQNLHRMVVADKPVLSASTGLVNIGNAVDGGYMEMYEQTAPAAPGADIVRIFAQDNGAGKTQLMARFSSGAAQQLAIQP